MRRSLRPTRSVCSDISHIMVGPHPICPSLSQNSTWISQFVPRFSRTAPGSPNLSLASPEQHLDLPRPLHHLNNKRMMSVSPQQGVPQILVGNARLLHGLPPKLEGWSGLRPLLRSSVDRVLLPDLVVRSLLHRQSPSLRAAAVRGARMVPQSPEQSEELLLAARVGAFIGGPRRIVVMFSHWSIEVRSAV